MQVKKLAVLLWLLAALAPVICVLCGDLAFWSITGHPDRILHYPLTTLLQALLAAAPLLLLARYAGKLRRRGALVPTRALARAGIAGFCLTLAVWAVYYAAGYQYVKLGTEAGVNLGVALLLLCSPLLVGFTITIVYLLARRTGLAAAQPAH